MNKWQGITILILLLSGELGIPLYSEACNTVSSIQCVNSTYFLWCVDAGNGTLVTIGDAEICPGALVCDDTQADGCVISNTVTTTELSLDLTTNAVTTTDVATSTVATTVTTIDSMTSEDSATVSDADFTCIYEGLYKAQDCSRFHVCYKMIWFIEHYFARCSEGLYWSSNEKRCVLQSLSDCP